MLYLDAMIPKSPTSCVYRNIEEEENLFPEKQKCPLRMLTSQRREEVLLGRDVAERMSRVRSKQ